MPYDNKLPRVLISENCISHLKMRVFWLSGPNGWPDKKLKHKGNVAHSTFRGGCVIDLVWKNYSLYVKIAIFSYKLDTLYTFALQHCSMKYVASSPHRQRKVWCPAVARLFHTFSWKKEQADFNLMQHWSSEAMLEIQKKKSTCIVYNM